MLVTALLFVSFLFFDPAGNQLRAREAMRLWAESVAPSVFPFLALLAYLTSESAERAYAVFAAYPMKKLFRLSRGALAPAVTGLLAGSPAGAIAIRERLQGGKICLREAYTLFALTGGPGPVFLVCAVGAGMFQSAQTGARLLFSALFSACAGAFLIARLLPRGETRAPCARARQPLSDGRISGAVMSTLNICAWMVLFRVYAGALPGYAACFTEVSWGCMYASEINNPLLAACICSFSGLCIFVQNASVLSGYGPDFSVLFLIKCVQMLFGGAAFWVLEQVRLKPIRVTADAFTASAAIALCVTAFLFFTAMICKRK